MYSVEYVEYVTVAGVTLALSRHGIACAIARANSIELEGTFRVQAGILCELLIRSAICDCTIDGIVEVVIILVTAVSSNTLPSHAVTATIAIVAFTDTLIVIAFSLIATLHMLPCR
jgi:hypothetical protein